MNFDKDNISDRVLKKIGQYCSMADFQVRHFILERSVIGSNIHIEVNECLLTLDRVFETIRDVSASQLEVLVTGCFSSRNCPGSRSCGRLGAASIPVRGSTTSSCFLGSSREGKHHGPRLLVENHEKLKRCESFQKHDPK